MKRLLLPLLLSSGCATTSALSTDWLTKEQLTWDASKYPDDAAVVLYRADRTLLETIGNDSSEVLRHEAIAIQKEGGFDVAEVRIPFNTRQQLIVLKARVLQPDGTVREVQARDVLVDTNGKGERDTQAKFFRFPDLRIGSIVEYVWVVRTPWVIGADDQDTLGPWPVREYEFELTGSRQLVFETIEYNSQQPIDVTTMNDGRHRLRFSLKDLPPREPEQWMPHWTFTEPRWAWRILGYKASSLITNNWFRTWPDIVESFGRRAWTDRTLFSGLKDRPDFSRCTDARCKVDVATNWVREKTTTVGVDSNREIDLAEAWKSGKASARERAMILRWVLAEAGVEAQFAFTTAGLSRQTAQSFPEWDQFNRLHVWVPAQPSIPRPIAIELEAEYCKAGQLSPQVQGQNAFVFWFTGGTVGSGESHGEWTRLDGEEAVGNVERYTHHARLDESGTLFDDVEHRGEGEASEPLQRTKQNTHGREFTRLFDNIAGQISALTHHDKERWLECDRLTGRCGKAWSVRAPRYAVKDGKSWLVPLTALHSLYETFDASTRKHDLHIRAGAGVVEESFELDAPPGFHVAQLPDTLNESGPGVSVRIVAERTKTGVRLSRRVSLSPGAYSKETYGRVRATFGHFQALRNTLLQFDPD